MITYAISDIHGCSEQLKSLLKKIKDFDKLIFLGDYIDRGPNSKEVIDIIRDLQNKYGDKIITLIGNHEDLCLKAYDNYDYCLWRNPGNGGSQTLKNFNGDVPVEYLNWMRNLKLYYEDDYFYYVHAGLRPHVEIEDNDRDDIIWIRYDFLLSDYKFKKRVIHGHTPGENVIYRDNRVNIDTGCVFGYKLSAIKIEGAEITNVISVENKNINGEIL